VTAGIDIKGFSVIRFAVAVVGILQSGQLPKVPPVPLRGHTSFWLGSALVSAVALLLGPLAIASSAATTPHATAAVMGSYVPVTSFRITDTRTGSGEPNAGQTLAANSTLSVPVTGVGTAPYPSVAALNVTAVDPRLGVASQGQHHSTETHLNPGDGGKSYV